MKRILTLAALCLLLLFNFDSAVIASEKQFNELPKCLVLTHCVLEVLKVDNVEESFKNVISIVEKTPRTKIVERNDNYIHAEAKTKWMKYTDDLIVKGFPHEGIIQVRSESRVGIGDNGVNKKRVDDFIQRLSLLE